MHNINTEILYKLKKKSMFLAYIIGAFFGGFGAHYFYTERNELGFLMVLSFIVAVIAPPYLFIHSLFVLAGVVHTKMIVDVFNINVLLDIEVEEVKLSKRANNEKE